jgi:glyoxylate/hydroxypyruvate reductase A
MPQCLALVRELKMKPHIYFNSNIDSPEEWRAALSQHFPNMKYSVGEVCEEPESVDVALVWKLPNRGLSAFKNLKAVLSLGAGINQLDPDKLPKDVPLARLVDDSLTQTMIEYAKAATFRYHRKFHLFERQSREAQWTFLPATLAQETSVGILGLGELGGAIAKALAGEGFEVSGWSRTPKDVDDIATYSGKGGLSDMLASSDIVINVLPLTDDTRSILSREFFAQCKRGACLINMGRGHHLVDADLLAAIDAGQIQAATLDVAIVEPLPPAHPFWGHPAVLVTPHVAGISTPETASIAVAQNIRRALNGERLAQQVDFSRGY